MLKLLQNISLHQAMQQFLSQKLLQQRSIILTSMAIILSIPLTNAQDVKTDELGFIIGTPDVLKPAEGARSVIISGNPSKPGMYVMQITWPPGTGSRPHFHNTARYINVLKGTWYTAWGPKRTFTTQRIWSQYQRALLSISHRVATITTWPKTKK